MWNSEALNIPQTRSAEATYRLSKEIPGMQLVPVAGGARLGPILRIPKGATIEAFGEGFNERTLKIRYQGSFYFVFLSDLEAPLKAGAAAQ